MQGRFLSSNHVRAMVVVYVMIGAGFAVLAQSPLATAATYRTQLVVGLQNDMTSMNYFDPATNTVWKAYMVAWGFESLLAHDQASLSYAFLADPAYGGGNGWTVDASGFNVTVQIRSGVTFHDGVTMNADDVVFTYQTLGWSTYNTFVTDPLWWPAKKYPLWNSTTFGGPCAGCLSHVGIEKLSANQVVFHLTKSYALFFYLTMEIPIIPRHIWKDHINLATQVDPLDPTKKVTDSFDRSIDFGFGSQPSQTAATIGTGMFKFDTWVRSQYSHISLYSNYWATAVGASHTYAGTVYPFTPRYLKSIQFLIYTSLDVISLALQKGEVDTLIWPLTPGFLTQVSTIPTISVEQVTDSGFFYISFNMRKSPWNNLTLRQAISMAIDKDYIVKTLMGGFGIKGYVPIAITNPNYINQSAQPPGFDKQGAAALLDRAGIRVDPATGFRRMADGTPIKASILTPPKDYDPVRADAGIMIANNLKSINLDIDSAPTSFDTIVAKAFTPPVDYDIYILGFLLGDFPESYLCNFFCSYEDPNIDPAGGNSAGYNNQVVDALIKKALVTVDNQARYKLVKDVEGIVVHDLPWNVLFYRKNLNAYRNDAWVGWVNTPPQLYNYWSLVNLAPAGLVTPPIPPTTGVFSVAMTVPGRVRFGATVPVDVIVANANVPVSGASVTLKAVFGNNSQTLTGATDSGGHAGFSWKVPLVLGDVLMTATATQGTSTATATKRVTITVGPPAPIATLNLSTTKPVIRPTDTTQITATLIDGTGAPMAGVNVSIDKKVLLGTIAPEYGLTSATGKIVFTYTPPSAALFPNQHLADLVRASVNIPDTIASDTQTQAMQILVYNAKSPDFRIVTVQGTPNLNLSTSNSLAYTTSITVKVTNFTNLYTGSTAGLAGKVVDAVLSAGNWNVTSPASVTTPASGLATFTFSTTTNARTALNHTSVNVRFQVHDDPNQVSDDVELVVSNAVLPTGDYAAKVTISNRTLDSAPTDGTASATVTVVDSNGAPVSGVPVFLQVLYGPLGLGAHFPWGYHYGDPESSVGDLIDYNSAGLNGLDLNSFGQGSLGGSFQNSTNNWANIYYMSDGARLPDSTIQYGVENFVEDFEVVGDWPVVDGCDPTGNATLANGQDIGLGLLTMVPWPSGVTGITPTAPGLKYYINVTSTTNLLGQLTVPLTSNPHRLDNAIQVNAYVGKPSATAPMRIVADACAFTASIQNAAFKVDSGLVVRRAPVFALGNEWMDKPISTNLDRVRTVHAQFYQLNLTTGLDDPARNVQVFLTRGAGRDARVTGYSTCPNPPDNPAYTGTRSCRTGATFGTVSTKANGALTWNVSEQYTKVRVWDYSVWPYVPRTVDNPTLGSSQALTFAFVPADPRYAYGGREQLFSGTGNLDSFGTDLGDFWLAPTFAVLIAKIPFQFVKGYMVVPTTAVFVAVSVDKTIVPVGGQATASFTVTDVYGNPVSDASVWSGPYQATTNATGQASITFSAGTGAVEYLASIVTPAGYATRAWYGVMASAPVVTYSVPSVFAQVPGKASTINVTLTNTLPVAGNVTVALVVDGTTVAVQTVSIASLGTKQVSFTYVFGTSGSHTVAVGTQSTTATIPAPTVPTPEATISQILGIGLLIAGLVLGAVVGLLLGRRGGKKPTMAPEERRDESPGAAEEELPPEENL